MTTRIVHQEKVRTGNQTEEDATMQKLRDGLMPYKLVVYNPITNIQERIESCLTLAGAEMIARVWAERMYNEDFETVYDVQRENNLSYQDALTMWRERCDETMFWWVTF